MLRPSFMVMPSGDRMNSTPSATSVMPMSLPNLHTPAKFLAEGATPATSAAPMLPTHPGFGSMEARLVEHLHQLQQQQQQQPQPISASPATSTTTAATASQPMMIPGFPRTMFDSYFYQYPMLYPSATPGGLPFTSPLAEQRSLIPPVIGPSAATRGALASKSSSEFVYYDQRASAPANVASKSSKKKRALAANDDGGSDTESASSVSETSSSPVEAREKRKRVKHAPGQGGTRRLKIDFIELGEPGEEVQFVGKCGSIIPHGLRGRHEMHNQPWEFTITHEKVEGVTVIRWSVKNLTSNKTVTVTESPFQARVRQKTGNTITSFVMRQALEQRVRDLEEMLEQPDIKHNPVQVANLQSLIKELRRKERNEGILFFGLRHEEVQRNRVLPPSSATKAAATGENASAAAASSSPDDSVDSSS